MNYYELSYLLLTRTFTHATSQSYHPKPVFYPLTVHVLATINVAINIITPPDWELVRSSTATEDGESQNEHDNLNTTTNSSSDNHVVLGKEDRALLSEVSLREETGQEVRKQRRVDTD
jgi:uncharacterized protein YpmB